MLTAWSQRRHGPRQRFPFWVEAEDGQQVVCASWNSTEASEAGSTAIRRSKTPLSKGSTIADHVTLRGRKVEAKFGPTAKLRPSQIRATEELGPDYRVDWWGPGHVGRLTGPAAALAGWWAGRQPADY